MFYCSVVFLFFKKTHIIIISLSIQRCSGMFRYFSVLFYLYIGLLMISHSACLPPNSGDIRPALRNGDHLPDLALPDSNGNIVPMSQVHDKIVLLDFWASWCKPCRDQHAALRRVDHRYKDSAFEGAAQGFEIYSVSFDEKPETWLTAIRKDTLDFPYLLCETRGMPASDIPPRFGFRQLPTSFLQMPDGTIIGVNLTPEKLEYELQERLKKNKSDI